MAFLLPRLHAFFQPSLIHPEVSSYDAWLSFEDVPLKWHYPLGLLYDLFSGAEPADLDPPGQGESAGASQATVEASTGRAHIPWKLTIHYTDFPFDQLIQLDLEGLTMRDTFINSVKEADYVRNGSARTVMSLSKEDSDNLWLSVQKRKSRCRTLHTGFVADVHQMIYFNFVLSITSCSTHLEWSFATSQRKSIYRDPPALSTLRRSQKKHDLVTCE